MAKKFLIGVVAAAAMMGCIKRTDVVNPTLETGTATIKGKILVNSDMTNDTLQNHLQNQDWTEITAWENEAGIEVSATIDVQDLDNNDDNSLKVETVRTTTDASGNWSLTVRTPKSGEIDVDIDYQDMLTTTVKGRLDSINGGNKGDLSEEWTIMIDSDSDGTTVTDGGTVTMDDRYFMLN